MILYPVYLRRKLENLKVREKAILLSTTAKPVKMLTIKDFPTILLILQRWAAIVDYRIYL